MRQLKEFVENCAAEEENDAAGERIVRGLTGLTDEEKNDLMDAFRGNCYDWYEKRDAARENSMEGETFDELNQVWSKRFAANIAIGDISYGLCKRKQFQVESGEEMDAVLLFVDHIQHTKPIKVKIKKDCPNDAAIRAAARKRMYEFSNDGILIIPFSSVDGSEQ